MPQQPAVVIIARHGPRIDAADQAWHLSTPTPYDPPLTYGGWNQTQALGIRIASLLHAREKAAEHGLSTERSHALTANGAIPVDSTRINGRRKDTAIHNGTEKKRKKIRHRVVIHTSPFLRCVQTSVAIAAGLAQFRPPGRDDDIPHVPQRPRTPLSLHSASPRLRAHDHAPSTHFLAPIAEPEHDSSESSSRSRVKIRVDAFLGEWLNPQYFEQITPPPPSAMMVATAKAELMMKEDVDLYTPGVSNKSSLSSLWRGIDGESANKGALDDMTAIRDALPPSAGSTRSRASTISSPGSSDGSWKAGHAAKRSFSPVAFEAITPFYQPLRPQYAVSGSDNIPRGYVSHARRACADVDHYWDSSKAPQNWIDGGSYGEEWSDMHKRFRKGLDHLVQWYAQHDVDAAADTGSASGRDGRNAGAEETEEEEEEDLVVVLVTHGAGSNALIGALTNQPVLLDVGMASLTMAVRRDDVPRSNASPSQSIPAAEGATTNGWARRPSSDAGLSSKYEMKLVSSSEHLRANPSKTPQLTAVRSNLPAFVEDHKNSGGTLSRSNTSSAVGSIRRPSAANLFAPRADPLGRSDHVPVTVLASKSEDILSRPSSATSGLWTPPNNRSPFVEPQQPPPISPSTQAPASPGLVPNPPELSKLPERRFAVSVQPSVIDEEESVTADNATVLQAQTLHAQPKTSPATPPSMVDSMISDGEHKRGSISDLPYPGAEPPSSLRRGLSQKGLWGARPEGRIERRFGQEPKRRWSVNRD